jgi:diacylglycerol kinase family enzyme
MRPVAEVKGTSAYLIINPAAGSAAVLLGSLTRAARERGIRVHVLESGEDVRLAALAAADDGVKSLAVAGGDGSVAAVAWVAVERGLPLVVVPTGTLNHFARDLGLDLARYSPSMSSHPATSGAWTSGGLMAAPLSTTSPWASTPRC